MTLDDILTESVDIWPRERISPTSAVTVLSKVVGDLAALARQADEGDAWTSADRLDWGRELGNLVATSVRLIDAANLDPENSVRRALDSQRKYAGGLVGEETKP